MRARRASVKKQKPTRVGFSVMVPRKGLEPPRCYSLVPETSASTNSATWAFQVIRDYRLTTKKTAKSTASSAEKAPASTAKAPSSKARKPVPKTQAAAAPATAKLPAQQKKTEKTVISGSKKAVIVALPAPAAKKATAPTKPAPVAKKAAIAKVATPAKSKKAPVASAPAVAKKTTPVAKPKGNPASAKAKSTQDTDGVKAKTAPTAPANAVVGTTITQSQWDAARNNLNANCGTNFAP